MPQTAGGTSEAEGLVTVLEIADESLVREWQPLREWVNENRDFLFWRQQRLKTYLSDWEQGGRSPADVLNGSALQVAIRYLRKRPEELNGAEISYINESTRVLRYRSAVRIVLAVVALLVLLGFALLVRSYISIKTPLPNTTNGNTNGNANFGGGGGGFTGGGMGGSTNANTGAGGNMNTGTSGNMNRGTSGGNNATR